VEDDVVWVLFVPQRSVCWSFVPRVAILGGNETFKRWGPVDHLETMKVLSQEPQPGPPRSLCFLFRDAIPPTSCTPPSARGLPQSLNPAVCTFSLQNCKLNKPFLYKVSLPQVFCCSNAKLSNTEGDQEVNYVN
jgi:hypothetical protein